MPDQPPFTEGEATAMSVLTTSRTSQKLSKAPNKTVPGTGDLEVHEPLPTSTPGPELQ
jgi:hypothetical protein